jgi:hypothetical protein
MRGLKEFSVFDSFYERALQSLNQLELKQETQRMDLAVERDAAKIAGELTELFYRRISESV